MLGNISWILQESFITPSPPILFKMIKVFQVSWEQFISVNINLIYVNIGEIDNLIM